MGHLATSTSARIPYKQPATTYVMSSCPSGMLLACALTPLLALYVAVRAFVMPVGKFYDSNAGEGINKHMQM